MISLKAHINNVALHHTIFDLPFGLMAAVLAADGHPEPMVLLWVALAITTGRAAAMAMDNLADLKYDSQQPRLSYRAMVRGEITKGEAKVFIVICLLLMVLSVAQLPPICLYLLPVAAIPCLVYPYLKRVTGWVHLFLGLAIAMAPAVNIEIVFLANLRSISGNPCFILLHYFSPLHVFNFRGKLYTLFTPSLFVFNSNSISL